MNIPKTAVGAICFVIGSAVGAVTTYFTVREKFIKESNKQIADMRIHYQNKERKLKLEQDILSGKIKAGDKKDTGEKEKKNEAPNAFLKKKPEKLFDKEKLDMSGTGNAYYKLMTEVASKAGVSPKAVMTMDEEEIRKYAGSDAERVLAERESPQDDEPEVDEETLANEEIDKVFEEAGVEEPSFEDMQVTQNPNPHPYIIDEFDFDQNFEWFQKETITYYIVDDVLADTDEDIMAQDVVGQDALDILRRDEADAVYVRNEKLSIDYEVVGSDHSYVEDILGIHTPPPIPKPSKKTDDEE